MTTAPETQQLFERIRALFGIVPRETATPTSDSPYASGDDIESFQIEHMPLAGGKPADATEAATAWLNTPNPTFGGFCPKIYLDGSPDQRAFLDAVLTSLEDGAFS